jgi:hypothetical protein
MGDKDRRDDAPDMTPRDAEAPGPIDPEHESGSWEQTLAGQEAEVDSPQSASQVQDDDDDSGQVKGQEVRRGIVRELGSDEGLYAAGLRSIGQSWPVLRSWRYPLRRSASQRADPNPPTYSRSSVRFV